MFMFVLSFYLYSMAMKDGCSMLTVAWKASVCVCGSFLYSVRSRD